MCIRDRPDIARPAELNVRIRSLFELIEHELKKLDPDASEASLEIGARTLWSGVHGAAGLHITDQLYTNEKKADQLIVHMLVSRFVDSWKR